MRANEPPGEIVTVPAHQKETEIFIIEGILCYANCTVGIPLTALRQVASLGGCHIGSYYQLEL